MITDLKFAFQCMKYTYNKKLFNGITVMFVLVGIFNLVIAVNNINYLMGGYLIVYAPIMLFQGYQTVNMAHLVITSSKYKRMMINIPTMLNCVSLILGYVCITVIYLCFLTVGRINMSDLGYLLMMQGIMILIVTLYMAASYKYYIISTVLFLILFMSAFVSATIYARVSDKDLLPVTAEIIIGIGCVFLGCIGYYGIVKMFYKRPMDKLATMTVLKNNA